MQRLSSNKAKRVLEFLIRKKLGIVSAEIRFTPSFIELNNIEVEILYNDGKGKTLPLVAEQHTIVGLIISHVMYAGSSFAKLLRWIEKQTQREAVFKIDGISVFTKYDSIETTLIEMELEDSHGN